MILLLLLLPLLLMTIIVTNTLDIWPPFPQQIQILGMIVTIESLELVASCKREDGGGERDAWTVKPL